MTRAAEELAYRIRWRAADVHPGSHRSRVAGSGEEFRGVVPLAVGREARRIDLRASVADPFGRPWVREFRQRSRIPVVLLADLSRAMRFAGSVERFELTPRTPRPAAGGWRIPWRRPVRLHRLRWRRAARTAAAANAGAPRRRACRPATARPGRTRRRTRSERPGPGAGDPLAATAALSGVRGLRPLLRHGAVRENAQAVGAARSRGRAAGRQPGARAASPLGAGASGRSGKRARAAGVPAPGLGRSPGGGA